MVQMVDPANSPKPIPLPTRSGITRWLSRLLGLAGTIVFLLGDKFLYEIKHVKFLLSIIIGIGGGVLLMLLGWAIGLASKSPKPERPV